MTIQHDAAELFGLAGTLPRPAWVVLDAARDHRFTGELVFHTDDRVHVYLDRGEIYLAETASDPSLGARLVDAGAVNAAQLERGTLRFGDTEHLGRLFERVPSVDRQFVVLVTEMMNEACVTDLARRQVSAVESIPYRHHPAGVYHWFGSATTRLHPGGPLPAPDPAEAPLAAEPPESLFDTTSNDTDPLVHWVERSWLDDGLASGTDASPASPPDPAGDDGEADWLSTDWTDRLETEGLPEPDDDPLAAPVPLPHRPGADAVDRFELIWPSGDVDDEFGSVREVDGEDDRDRVGPTARIARRVDDAEVATPTGPPSPAPAWSAPPPPPPAPPSPPAAPESGTSIVPSSDDLTLEVRRAVASVDVGSLDARRRLAEAAPTAGRPAADPSNPPSASVWSAHGADPASRSVFHVATDVPAATGPAPVPVESAPLRDDDLDPPRVSALRRLIGGLRKR